MKISVTQQHIDYGLRGCPGDCPIALALCDAGFEKAYAYRSQLLVQQSEDGKVIGVPTPKNVSYFIGMFDHAQKELLSPFEFEIDIPSNVSGRAVEPIQ